VKVHDFGAHFFPRNGHSKKRWERINTLCYQHHAFPPVRPFMYGARLSLTRAVTFFLYNHGKHISRRSGDRVKRVEPALRQLQLPPGERAVSEGRVLHG
jgi:hypothetical protein